jgi:pectate lyase
VAGSGASGGSRSDAGAAGTVAGAGDTGGGSGEGGAPGDAGSAGAPGGAGGNAGAGGSSSGPTGDTDLEGLIGFATVAGYGLATTAGAGDGAPTVSVASYAEFVSAVSDASPRIVQVSGRITGGGAEMVDIGSNKTIIGMGAGAIIDGFGFDINGWTPAEVEEFGTDVCEPESAELFARVENVVVRNLTFVNTPDDSINVQCYSHHVWIDHNTFNVSYDGSVDVKRGSDLVTVSFNHFIATDKTMLLGHSADNGAQDRGFLRVTYHHNWFDNTATRTPRVRFGFAHVFNNYLDSSDYFLGLGVEAKIYAEANYVERAKTLTQTFTESEDYHLTWLPSNHYDVTTITRANDSGSTQSDWLDADGSVAAPTAYPYTAEAASAIPALRDRAGAGKL